MYGPCTIKIQVHVKNTSIGRDKSPQHWWLSGKSPTAYFLGGDSTLAGEGLILFIKMNAQVNMNFLSSDLKFTLRLKKHANQG